MSIIEQARQVLDIEARAILNLKDRIGPAFERAVRILLSCRGKVVVVGMGKSGQVCRKIAATLASTGTPAFFVHPAEGVHGDLGMIAKGDVVMGISNSGETAELLQILCMVKRLDLPIIALTGRLHSGLAKSADVVLDISVEEEACPMGLAPTASTSAALAMGDALAIALLNERGFKESDFALLHPGGMLGKKLLYRVKDLMKTGDQLPVVGVDADMQVTLMQMSAKRMGVTAVTDEQGRLVGVITDGDLRRFLRDKRRKNSEFFNLKAGQLMTREPKTIEQGALAGQAIHGMEKYKITSLFIVDESTHLIGIIHLHALLQAKIV